MNVEQYLGGRRGKVSVIRLINKPQVDSPEGYLYDIHALIANGTISQGSRDQDTIDKINTWLRARKAFQLEMFPIYAFTDAELPLFDDSVIILVTDDKYKKLSATLKSRTYRKFRKAIKTLQMREKVCDSNLESVTIYKRNDKQVLAIFGEWHVEDNDTPKGNSYIRLIKNTIENQYRDLNILVCYEELPQAEYDFSSFAGALSIDNDTRFNSIIGRYADYYTDNPDAAIDERISILYTDAALKCWDYIAEEEDPGDGISESTLRASYIEALADLEKAWPANVPRASAQEQDKFIELFADYRATFQSFDAGMRGHIGSAIRSKIVSFGDILNDEDMVDMMVWMFDIGALTFIAKNPDKSIFMMCGDTHAQNLRDYLSIGGGLGLKHVESLDYEEDECPLVRPIIEKIVHAFGAENKTNNLFIGGASQSDKTWRDRVCAIAGVLTILMLCVIIAMIALSDQSPGDQLADTCDQSPRYLDDYGSL